MLQRGLRDMGRINFVLLLALVATALYLVHIQYESRRLYVEMEKALAHSRTLATDEQRLQVEKRAQATALRVEKLAIDQLQMRTVTPAITHYITSPESRSTSLSPERMPAAVETTGAPPRAQ